jgi:hypothetical protein
MKNVPVEADENIKIAASKRIEMFSPRYHLLNSRRVMRKFLFEHRGKNVNAVLFPSARDIGGLESGCMTTTPTFQQ